MNSQTTTSSERSHLKALPIFNGQYEMIKNVGSGKTAKVYLVRDKDTRKQFALKLIRHKYLMSAEKNIHGIEKEIEILRGLKHDNVMAIHDYGCEGTVVKSSAKELKNQVYIMTEYIGGGTMFDLLENKYATGESAGRILFTQIANTLSYLHKIGVVHRDLKLENILVDNKLNLKLADFGFASYNNIKALESFKGTKTYMAPEIRQQ